MPETIAERPITLEALGWNATLEESFARFRDNGRKPGRVAIEDKHHYGVWTRGGPLTARVSGRLLHTASSPADLPKVGDWVALAVYPGERKAVVHHVLPRRTRLSRKTPGREVEEQILVTNVDAAFVVQALDHSFNPRLLERHLLMVLEGGVRPVIVLNKADLCPDIPERLEAARKAAGTLPVLVASGRTGKELDRLAEAVRPGETVVFIGASGVGKSTLINRLYGAEVQATAEVRESDSKGRHTTTWRELILLPNGTLVIDTPGMREFQMWLSGEGIHETFPDIEELTLQCRFRDCSHAAEQGCAILEAVAAGRLTPERREAYLKLKHEIEFLERVRRHGGPLERGRSFRKARAPRKT